MNSVALQLQALHLDLISVLLSLSFVSSYCSGANPYDYFSTKTPYAWVHSSPNSVPLKDDLYYLKELDGMACSAVHTSVVIRHGARYPGLNDVQDISDVHERLVVAMEPDVHPELYEWKNRFPTNNDKAISHLGEDEQEALGKRMATRLYSLFLDEDISNVRFIVSSAVRTKESASSFYEGFTHVVYGEEETEDEFDAEMNDELLRFFDHCARYVYTVSNNKTAMKEFIAFLSSDKVIDIKNKIGQKLQIKDDILTPENVRLIYLICGYEKASFESSPWCSLLDENDMKVMEYLGDLKHYYKNGHGYNITWLQSCPLLSEIFLTMDETIVEIESSDEDEEIDSFALGQFFFGHAETMGPVFSALGLFNDSTPLRADNYDEQEDREFRTSKILPFSANIMFILYECVPEEFSDVDDEIEEADYYLKMLVNERPQLIPGCKELYCPYHDVREHFHDLVDGCHFKKLCKHSKVKDEL